MSRFPNKEELKNIELEKEAYYGWMLKATNIDLIKQYYNKNSRMNKNWVYGQLYERGISYIVDELPPADSNVSYIEIISKLLEFGAYEITVEGHSMIGSGIDHGDHVICLPERNIVNNKIYLIELQNMKLIKKITRKDDEITVISTNYNYPDVICHKDDIKVLSEVIYIIKRMPQ